VKNKTSTSAQHIAVIALACLLSGTITPAHAQTQENELKAAFIYNFINFTDWSMEIARYIKLCTVADDQLSTALESLEDKKVKNSTLTVRKLEPNEDPDRCHVVFVSNSERAHLPKLIRKMGLNILTITDSPGWAERGMMIEMSVEQQRIVFNVNEKTANANLIKISSKLLRLAKRVY
jgi:YfiR/HmsC-like